MGSTDQSERTEAPEAWRPVVWISPGVTAKAEAAPAQRRNSKGLVLCEAPAWSLGDLWGPGLDQPSGGRARKPYQ